MRLSTGPWAVAFLCALAVLGAIVVNPRSVLLGFARIRFSLARNYGKDHADSLGIFLVPVIEKRT